MTNEPVRKLERSREHHVVFGVAGGVAEYLNTDPTLVRIVFALALIAFGPVAFLAYLAMALIMPQTPSELW
jgi:phage shock protein C